MVYFCFKNHVSDDYLDNINIINYDLNRYLNGFMINQKDDNYKELSDNIYDLLYKMEHIEENECGVIEIDSSYISLIFDGSEKENFFRKIIIYKRSGSQFYILYNDRINNDKQYIYRYDIKNNGDIIKSKLDSEGLLILTMRANCVYHSNYVVKCIEKKKLLSNNLF